MVSALASRATGTGSISGFGKGIIGVRTRFPSCICRHEMKTARRPSDRHVNWRPPVQGKSHPVQVKEPYGNSKWLTGLNSVNWTVKLQLKQNPAPPTMRTLLQDTSLRCWNRELNDFPLNMPDVDNDGENELANSCCLVKTSTVLLFDIRTLPLEKVIKPNTNSECVVAVFT